MNCFPYIHMRLFQLTRPYYLYAVAYRRSWKTCLASRLRKRLEGEKGKRSDVVSLFYSSHLPPRAYSTRRLPSLVFQRSKREGWGWYVSSFYFPSLICKRDKTNYWGLVSSFSFSFYSWFDILPKRYFKTDTWLVVSDDSCALSTGLGYTRSVISTNKMISYGNRIQPWLLFALSLVLQPCSIKGCHAISWSLYGNRDHSFL